MTAVSLPSTTTRGRAPDRSVLLDATPLFGDATGADAEVLRRLVASGARLAGAVRMGPGRPEGLTRAALLAGTGRSDTEAESGTGFASLRAWLLGEAAALPPRQPGQTAGGRERLDPLLRLVAPRPFAPRGAVLLRAGLGGWDGAALQGWLASRPDLVPVGLLGSPLALDAPEYAAAGDGATVGQQLAALSRTVRAVVVPGEAARARFAAVMRAKGRRDPAIHVIPEPSVLAGTRPMRFDAVLAAVPYVVVAGPIESRGNLALLLNLWRDLLHSGAAIPKLVLAGSRGRQIEEIRPLLDWGEAIRPHVREAPGLGPQALRDLLGHARALLAPAFWDRSGALLRDAAQLGVPVVAADVPAYREIPGAIRLLNPIDGLAWRDAILLQARSGRRRSVPDARLPDWPGYRDALLRVVAPL